MDKASHQQKRDRPWGNQQRNRQNNPHRLQRRDDGQGDHAQQAVVQQSAAQAAGFSLRWIKGVQQKIPPFETDNQRNHQCDRHRLPNIAEGYSQHIAEQDMVEMNIGLDRYVQHQSGAKHAGEDNPHDGIALESAVIVEKTGRHGAQQTSDKRADGEGDADNVGQHHARKDRVAHGVAHQRPAFEHQKHRQQRAGNGDDDRYRYRIDHKRKLERGQEQVQHAASLARRRLASRPCFGAKIKVMRNNSVCATTIMPPVAPSR